MVFKSRRSMLVWGNVSLLLVIVSVLAFSNVGEDSMARVLRQQKKSTDLPWISLSAEDVFNGTTVPPNSNVTFTLPLDIDTISRKVLLGDPLNDIRYWGYCFPPIVNDQPPYSLSDSADAKKVARLGSGPITTLPGYFFLSEKERSLMKQRSQPSRSVLDVLVSGKTPTDNAAARSNDFLRNQKELFKGGETCYIMTEASLPIGLDFDEDKLNDGLEKKYGTDPAEDDTDGDGLDDGKEVLLMGSDPALRDTDGDGIIDGIEDKNRNGHIDSGETSPVKKDSDDDGLCDGYCIVQQGVRNTYKYPKGYTPTNRQQVQWEDKNVDGVLDDGELNPLKADSDDDGILDDQEFILCHGVNGLQTITDAGCE